MFGRGYEPSDKAPWDVRKPQEVSNLVSKELRRAYEVLGSLRVTTREVSQVSRGVTRCHDTSELHSREPSREPSREVSRELP